jgi:pimeloyl-ACP methyl ester carboxylesterase
VSATALDVLRALGADARPGEVARGSRVLRWCEAGAGTPPVVMDAALGETGPLAYAGILPALAERTRAIAYDRAGLGASDPVETLTVQGQIDDLAAVLSAASDAPGVVVGHSWGGLLGLLLAHQQPELVAGLLLLDPADETYWRSLPAEHHEQQKELGITVLQRYDDGDLAELLRDVFTGHASRLSPDPAIQLLVLDAYVASYEKRSQAAMILGENRMFTAALPWIHEVRASSPLPDIPITVLSATTGSPPDQRRLCTELNIELAASVPRGNHLELPDTSHAVNQENPEAVVVATLEVVDALSPAGG